MIIHTYIHTYIQKVQKNLRQGYNYSKYHVLSLSRMGDKGLLLIAVTIDNRRKPPTTQMLLWQRRLGRGQVVYRTSLPCFAMESLGFHRLHWGSHLESVFSLVDLRFFFLVGSPCSLVISFFPFSGAWVRFAQNFVIDAFQILAFVLWHFWKYGLCSNPLTSSVVAAKVYLYLLRGCNHGPTQSA